MRKTLKQILILSFTLITSNYIWKNLDFQNKLTTIILVALILSIFESIIKPIIKILLLPITIITLGTTRILINTLGLYLAVFLIHNFELKNININSFAWQGFTFPDLKFDSFWAYLVSSITINLIYNLFTKTLYKKKKN
ncbi:phage holin family protein [Patescibacteria group bacterium]|nr:phage holin family protein [Patescibacteria group bacterium]